MGWMHDFTEYMKLDPYFRKDHHNQMTFAMSYAYSENYILVLSHDEVVHLKCSMLNKMPGIGADKYSNLKAGYAFMMGHAEPRLQNIRPSFSHSLPCGHPASCISRNDSPAQINNGPVRLFHMVSTFFLPYLHPSHSCCDLLILYFTEG